MSAADHHLVAGAIGLCASVMTLAVASFILLRRPESASLFVEDQFGYFVVKVMGALLFAIAGMSGFWRSLDYLFAA